MEKKIIAALELAEHEVRLIVGQFYNGRLNILKVERVAHQGINNLNIVNKNSVREAILKAVANASSNLGSQITSVLVILPGFDLEVTNDVHSIAIEDRITRKDLASIYAKFLDRKTYKDRILINTILNRYHINGIATRKIPIDEKCYSVSVEANQFYSDMETSFAYIKLIESTGLKIIDIVIDDLALGKEASLYQASIEKPVIAINLDRFQTKLSLFDQGRLVTNIYLKNSFKKVFSKMRNRYDFDDRIIERLIYYNLDVNEVDPSSDPIFAWSTRSKDHSLSKLDISEFILDDVLEILEEILEVSTPIFEYKDSNILLTGEASIISGLDTVLAELTGRQVKHHIPSGFGVKNPALSTIVGAFYYYKDLEYYLEDISASVDLHDFYDKNIYKSIEEKEKMNTGSNNFTKKLKDLFVE